MSFYFNFAASLNYAKLTLGLFSFQLS